MTTLGPHTAVARARTLIELNRPLEALPLLSTAIASDPDAYSARCLMALALIALDRDREAVKAAGEAIRVEPEGEWGFRLLSTALVRVKDIPAAVEAAERAVALEPEMAECRIALSHALIAARRSREAAVEAGRAVKLQPEEAAAHAAVGQVALTRGEHRTAEKAFRRSLELDPEQPLVLNNLGVVLQREGREAEAIKLFESAARADPRDDLGRRNLATSARNFLAGGGWVAPFVAFFVLQAAVRASIGTENISSGLAAAIALGCVVIVFAGMQLNARGREAVLSPAARAVLRDERRRTRWRPWTWEPTGYVPWPIALLYWPPPQVTAVFGGLLFVAVLLDSGGDEASDWAGLAVIALFTAFFALRWRDKRSD